jgi:hypothetical protein
MISYPKSREMHDENTIPRIRWYVWSNTNPLAIFCWSLLVYTNAYKIGRFRLMNSNAILFMM